MNKEKYQEQKLEFQPVINKKSKNLKRDQNIIENLTLDSKRR